LSTELQEARVPLKFEGTLYKGLFDAHNRDIKKRIHLLNQITGSNWIDFGETVHQRGDVHQIDSVNDLKQQMKNVFWPVIEAREYGKK